MLVVSNIRENKEKIIRGLEKKGVKNASDQIKKVLNADQNRRESQAKLDEVLAESNQYARSIGKLMKEGRKDEAEEAKKKSGELKKSSKELGESLSKWENELKELLYALPNTAHESVPDGNSEEDNEEIEREGDTNDMGDDALAHWDLIREYDIIDFDLGVKITGAGFPVYKGQGARLQRAMVNYFLDQATEAGYMEVQPPILVNKESGYGTGQLPDKDGQMYHMQDDDLYVIPTAEVPITNMFRDLLMDEKELPIKCVGYTPCFRREAGSWGAHVRGLNRLHQFDKVEVVQIRKPEESYQALEEMKDHVAKLLRNLGLPFRILRLCGGDLGFTSAITYDFEVYSRAQKRWLEVSSVSNFEDYQANRLMLRYKGESRKPVLLHTLNGSALALPRVLAALLENNQVEQGITIPEVLRPYCGFEKITK
ncbi:serine--tRNA ligase [Roseivirga sp. BDSF3-8]|uniref:serine--tRNA ligase n=1 Tax=Roseivirga sp. BDSF3-8 TaxID=3241598 RepID=UPI003531ED73